jgi:hypothetical protein
LSVKNLFFALEYLLIYFSLNFPQQGEVVQTAYPNWVMGIALSMIIAGVLPMPIVYLLRRCQCLQYDLDIHQGSIRRNETTASTKEMIDEDDVSTFLFVTTKKISKIYFEFFCNLFLL